MPLRNARTRRAFTPRVAEVLDARRLLTTFTVDTLLDGPTGDTDGLLSLREAVEAANADAAVGDARAGDGVDRVVFSPGLAGGNLFLTAGPLAVTEGLRIDGRRVTIDAGGEGRHLEVSGPIHLHLVRLAIAGGGVPLSDSAVTGNAADRTGGGLLVSGGRVNLRSSTVAGNTAVFGGGVGVAAATDGGAAPLLFTSGGRSAITDNTARFGGGLENRGTMTLRDVDLSGNAADYGGVLFAEGGSTTRSLLEAIAGDDVFGGGRVVSPR